MQPVTDDNLLLAGFQDGDSWADKQVFDLYYGPLVLFADRITGNLAAAEDIACEALEKAIDRRLDFAALSKLKRFLYQVVHNAAINQVTADRRHRVIHEPPIFALRTARMPPPAIPPADRHPPGNRGPPG